MAKKGGAKRAADKPSNPRRSARAPDSDDAPKPVSPRKGERRPLTAWYLPTSRPFESVRRAMLFRVVFFLLGACAVVYLRSVPLQAIPEKFQDRVESAIPPWLNSSMHLLNGLPALNTTHFNGPPGWRGPSPGELAREAGQRPHHPVVIVPGFISSGLELWEGLKCGKHFFRQRMWGTPAMAKAYFTDRQCWMQHMRLDTITGLDPPGIKLRAVTGLEAVDWFVPGYFVWGKVIESLGEVGYDANMIHAATFDWRLSPDALEQRDGYFTRLKHSVETLVAIHKVPVALLAHSYGDQLVRYFLNWVETPVADGGGGGGKRWTDAHVAVYVDIAGPMLGIPKTVPSLLSGEMRDTAILGQLEGLLGQANPLDRFVAGTLGTVAATFRTWGSLWAMLPRGGTDIWGADDAHGSPDDAVAANGVDEADEPSTPTKKTPPPPRRPDADERDKDDEEPNVRRGDPKVAPAGPLRHFLSMRTKVHVGRRRATSDAKSDANAVAAASDDEPDDDDDDDELDDERLEEGSSPYRNMTVVEALELLFERIGPDHPRQTADYRQVVLGDEVGASSARASGWFRRLVGATTSLLASGTGSSSSSSSSLGPRPAPARARVPAARFGDPLNSPLPNAPNLKIFCVYGVGKSTERAYHYVHRPDSADRPFALDVSRHGGGVERGVTSVDGDGSIPLVSLGYMCASGWRRDASLNPGRAKVTIREYPHRALPLAWGGGIQEGKFSGDHVNIMGNHEMIADVLRAVTGRGDEVEERVHSKVMELSENVHRLREARRAAKASAGGRVSGNDSEL